MEINWFTFFAQIVNFLILLVVLQRVLYRPIIRAMDQRESTIRDRLQSAAQKEQTAQQEAERYQQLQHELEAQKAGLLAEAKAEVEQIRQVQLQAVQQEVGIMQERWHSVVQQQQTAFLRELRHQMIQQLQTIVRRVLADLAEVELEHRLITVFLHRINHLTEAEQQALCSVANPGNHAPSSIVIHSAFAIAEADQRSIVQTLQQRLQLSQPIHLQFETNPQLICGIELRATGCKLAWSLENYLEHLEEQVSTVFEEEVETR